MLKLMVIMTEFHVNHSGANNNINCLTRRISGSLRFPLDLLRNFKLTY